MRGTRAETVASFVRSERCNPHGHLAASSPPPASMLTDQPVFATVLGMGSPRLAVAAVLFFGLALMAVLGSTYFGHASSPYGNCFGPSGRPGPCVVVARKLSASDSAQLAQALGGRANSR